MRPEEAHIGEGQLLIEWPLEEAQLFILIGRKDLWHHHYGTAALVAMLDEAFDNLELHRVWVDVPEYNEHALQMFGTWGLSWKAICAEPIEKMETGMTHLRWVC